MADVSLVGRKVGAVGSQRFSIDRPAPTVMAEGIAGVSNRQFGVIGETDPIWDAQGRATDPETGQNLDLVAARALRLSGRARRLTLTELRRLCGFPDDFTLTGSWYQRWERLGRAVPPPMAAAIASALRDQVLTQGASSMGIIGVGSYNPPAGQRGNRHVPAWQSPDRPAPTIGTEYRREVGGTGCLLTDDQPERLAPMTDKPPYRVPSMAEINALPWNGLTTASTFSGCGGSSLGYRMAGFRVLWASEFVPAARDTYLANAAPSTVVDGRDIRDVSAEDVLTALGMGAGELDLLDGSPPCASFSTAGKRHEGWGKVKSYSDTAQRTDDLFYEYARLVRGIQPRVFVAENVSGLVKGTAKGYFIRIMGELRACGYRVQAKLLDAQWLGVPQARQRLIIIGVRNDLGRDPAYPTPLPYRYSVREALPWVLKQGDNGGFGQGQMRPATALVHDTSAKEGTNFSGGEFTDRPCPAISVGVNSVNSQHYQVHGAPIVVHDTGAAPGTHFAGGEVTDQPCPTITAGGTKSTSHHHYQVRSADQTGWDTVDPETGKELAIRGRRANAVPDQLGPARSVRRFALGELRRICGFPDDFVLTGTYEQRWERLGRAVPPVMMAAIAAAVRDRVLLPAAVRA